MASRGSFSFVSARTRRSLTLLWAALFLGSLLMQSMSFAGAPPALAASGLLAATVQGFEIDGDLVGGNAATNPAAIPDGTPPPDLTGTLTDGQDWLDGGGFAGVVDPPTPPSSALINDPTDSQSDDIFIGGAKEDDTCTWGYTTGKPTGKDDFDHVMAYAKFVGGKAYFYAGAERFHTQGGGDTTIDFELNRNVFRSFGGGPVVADRSLGDLLISLEFANGGSNPEVRIFQVTDFVECQTPGTGEKVIFTEKTNAQVANAVNSATNFVNITGFSGAGNQDPIATFDFAEISIDLDALGISPSCPGFAAGHIRSRAGGDIDSSQLKDTAAPFPIDLNTCGKIKIEKVDEDGDPLGGATFSVSPNPIPGGTGDLSIKDNDDNDADNRDGFIQIDPAKPGEYTVCETEAPEGYVLAAQCDTQTLPNNGTITFQFKNELGSIAWLKHNGSGALLGGATFTVDPLPVGGGDLITVVDNTGQAGYSGLDADNEAGEFLLRDVPIGSYEICETVAPAGYIGDTTCQTVHVTQEDPDVSAEDPWVNTLGSLRWVKNGPNGTDLLGGATFTITPNPLTGTATLVVLDGGADDKDATAGEFQIDNARVGTYSICETTPPTGYIGDPDCGQLTINATTPNPSLAAGTFINTLGSLRWVKNGPNGTDLLGGATFTITPNPLTGTATLVVLDGGADDKDATAGEFQIDNARVGTYSICETTPPTGYIGDPDCGQLTINATTPNPSLAAGTFINTLGSISWIKTKGDANKTLLAGATFSVTPNPYGADSLVVIDCQALPCAGDDKDPTGGEFQLVNVPTGTYTIAELIAPDGYVRDTDTCSIIVNAANPTGDKVCEFQNPPIPPVISIVKTAGQSQENQVADGGTYSTELFANNTTYKYVVTNTGDVRLINVTVVDDNGTPGTGAAAADDIALTCPKTALDPDESMTCFFTKTVSQNTTNIAKASGVSVGEGTPVSDEDNANVVIVGPAITIVKTAGASNASQTADGGTYTTEAFTDNVVYKYVVTNTGDVTLNNISVVDDNGTPGVPGDDFAVTCPKTSLVADESMTCFATRTVSADRTNIATSTGFTPQQPNVPVTDTDDAIVDVVAPAIRVVKTAGAAADGAVLVTLPGNVTFSYVVTNTGDTTLTNVSVKDDNGTASTSDDFLLVCPKTTLIAGEFMTCTATINITANRTNIATASGTSPQGSTVNDTDDAVVQIRNPLLTILKAVAGNTAGSIGGTPQAKQGDTLTFTLTYDITNGPVTGGVITDVLPLGYTYVANSATASTPGGEFTFVSFTAATRTLRWTAATVTQDGSVTYQVTVAVGAAELPQPLVNVAVIDSNETNPDDDDQPVLVQEPPAPATATPRITPPPTDLAQQAPSNPGFGLMLALLGLAGFVLAIGYMTPVPAQARRRNRR